MTEGQKAWIDNATYITLLEKWRFGKGGDPLFQDETGKYYVKIMREKEKAISNNEKVAASKRVGWRK